MCIYLISDQQHYCRIINKTCLYKSIFPTVIEFEDFIESDVVEACRELRWFKIKESGHTEYEKGPCPKDTSGDPNAKWDYDSPRSCDNCAMGVACYRECYPLDKTLATTCRNYCPPLKPEHRAMNLKVLAEVFSEPIQEQ